MSRSRSSRTPGTGPSIRPVRLVDRPFVPTTAPIIAADGWQAAYAEQIDAASVALSPRSSTAPIPDLAIELITHRYSLGSKVVLQRWYPDSGLEMGTEGRTEKRTRFGSVKQVYDAATMRAPRTFFETGIALALPYARILYWTRDVASSGRLRQLRGEAGWVGRSN